MSTNSHTINVNAYDTALLRAILQRLHLSPEDHVALANDLGWTPFEVESLGERLKKAFENIAPDTSILFKPPKVQKQPKPREKKSNQPTQDQQSSAAILNPSDALPELARNPAFDILAQTDQSAQSVNDGSVFRQIVPARRSSPFQPSAIPSYLDPAMFKETGSSPPPVPQGSGSMGQQSTAISQAPVPARNRTRATGRKSSKSILQQAESTPAGLDLYAHMKGDGFSK